MEGQRSGSELDVDVIVYVETNFLMSVAMGREARGDDLLAAASASVHIAIPTGCYMESFSAFEDEQKRRDRFRAELEKQITQLKRDTTSAHAATLLRRLEESRIANNDLLNDIQDRLFRFVERAAGVLARVPTPPKVIRAAVTNMLIPDPTDNVILHSIIENAKRCPAHTKALLTDNTNDFNAPDVEAALKTVGINKHFRNVENVLGWLGSLLTARAADNTAPHRREDEGPAQPGGDRRRATCW
jgi:rRNA-processing protein FCF1